MTVERFRKIPSQYDTFSQNTSIKARYQNYKTITTQYLSTTTVFLSRYKCMILLIRDMDSICLLCSFSVSHWLVSCPYLFATNRINSFRLAVTLTHIHDHCLSLSNSLKSLSHSRIETVGFVYMLYGVWKFSGWLMLSVVWCGRTVVQWWQSGLYWLKKTMKSERIDKKKLKKIILLRKMNDVCCFNSIFFIYFI